MYSLLLSYYIIISCFAFLNLSFYYPFSKSNDLCSHKVTAHSTDQFLIIIMIIHPFLFNIQQKANKY
jgi:hypothetical protein